MDITFTDRYGKQLSMKILSVKCVTKFHGLLRSSSYKRWQNCGHIPRKNNILPLLPFSKRHETGGLEISCILTFTGKKNEIKNPP